MFQFSGFPTYGYGFTIRWQYINTAGFPHSEICGSQDICSYPQLIAACHVLLRLLMPRHSPCALVRLNFLCFFQLCSRSLELLEFLNIFFGLLIHCEKVLSFCALNRYSTFRWNCIFTQIGKTYNSYFANLVKNICPLICSFLLFNILYSVFNERRYSLPLFTKWIVKSE